MRARRICIALALALMSTPVAAEDFLSGVNLYRNVARYASFGTHRFGSDGERATARAFVDADRRISARGEGAFK